MFKRLYDWLIALSQSASAPYALAAVAFAESSFFPIPPDVILAPMSLAKPRLAWRYALIATLASVLGGMLGYAIGALLYDTLGQLADRDLRLRRPDRGAARRPMRPGARW